MTDEKKPIGEITELSEFDVKWKIDKFFSFSERNKVYSSPRFTLSNCEWYLNIYLNGDEESEGWISLYLWSCSLLEKGTTFNLNLMKCDGTVEKTSSKSRWIFDEPGGFGNPTFFKRSELIERKTELTPSDTLTIICSIKMHDDFNSTAKTSSLSDNLLEMFTSQTACDATLQVKHEQIFAHKFILMARSSVFARMFETPMKENATGVVHIEDCDPEAFKEFLVYLYSGKLESLTDHMFELYQIADKYDVEDLMSDCIIAMMGNLSVENVTNCTRLAKKFNINSLKMKSQKYFNESYAQVFHRPEWKILMKEDTELANELLIKMAEHYDNCDTSSVN